MWIPFSSLLFVLLCLLLMPLCCLLSNSQMDEIDHYLWLFWEKGAENLGLSEDSLDREVLRDSLRQVGVGVAGGVESSPFWWWLADKALLSGTRGSHEWLCKQLKREGTFALAESAVKRFPVTVIAAFGGNHFCGGCGWRREEGGAARKGTGRCLVYLQGAEGQFPVWAESAQHRVTIPLISILDLFHSPGRQSTTGRSRCGRWRVRCMPPLLWLPGVLFSRLSGLAFRGSWDL